MANFLVNGFLIVLFWQWKLASASTVNKCIAKNSCVCSFSEFSKIDLSTITPKDESEFLSSSKKNKSYYFHGCVDGIYSYIDKKNKTQKIGASLIVATTVGNDTRYDNFTDKEINFEPAVDHNPNAYQIVYKNAENVNASIRLVCDDFNVNFLNVLDINTNSLALISPHVCIHTIHPGLSTGSILLILFFFCVLTYLMGGMLLLYFMRGARGVEIIPNIDFWKSLPGLVKDGVIFILSGCRPTFVSTADSYDRI